MRLSLSPFLARCSATYFSVMKTRPTPNPINYKRPLPEGLRTDPQVIKWSMRLAGDSKARPSDLTEEQLAWVYLEVMKRRAEFSPAQGDLYLKAMSETCPVTAAPELERGKLAEDLGLLFAQPEMRDFYAAWQGRRGASGPEPCFFTSKALMTLMGMGGISSHADDVYTELTEPGSKLWKLFRGVVGSAPAQPAGYQHALKQFKRLGASHVVMEANVRMVRALDKLLPGRGS
jgi:hypothetical protein